MRRMLSVAEALRAKNATVRFVARRLDIELAPIVEKQGFSLSLLPPPISGFEGDGAIPHSQWAGVPQELDAEQTIAELRRQDPIEVMIVDHYSFAADWHVLVADALRVPVMVIDDLADRPIAGRWLVDHNYHPDHAAKYAGLLQGETAMLAGPAYAMLSERYARAHRYQYHREVCSIGIFLGGVDLPGDNLKVLEALEAIGWAGPAEIVTTGANPALAELAAACEARAATKLSLDLPDLLEFFASHDLQIGAGGGSIWERCCIGAPTVTLICAENQRLSVPYLDDIGVVAGYDMLSAGSSAQGLANLIQAIIANADRRAAMHEKGMVLVDGLGAARIAAALTER